MRRFLVTSKEADSRPRCNTAKCPWNINRPKVMPLHKARKAVRAPDELKYGGPMGQMVAGAGFELAIFKAPLTSQLATGYRSEYKSGVREGGAIPPLPRNCER
jgi:hypothetical protein